jgi:hypothetical protein
MKEKGGSGEVWYQIAKSSSIVPLFLHFSSDFQIEVYTLKFKGLFSY